jgi:glycosyltransferase involved in cell wall biosynthesis
MKDKIKILICSISLEKKGGVTNYVQLILNNLSSDKFQIKHFVQGPKTRIRRFLYPIIILIQLIKFKEKLKKFKPDIVQFNPSLDWGAILRDYLFMKYAKKYGFSVLFFVNGWKEHISKHFFKKDILSKFFYKVFILPDVIIVLANSFKNDLIKLGITSEKIIVMTTLVESEKFKPQNRIFNPPYTLLFCSRIGKLKGIFQLLDAFQLIIHKYPKTKLIYIGQGSDFNTLNKKIDNMKLKGNVECIGYKSGQEKIEYFHKSDMLILPSFTEGFPTVFCEAIAAGLPFIGTHVGGLIDAFEDEKQGLVIRSMPPKSEEISEKILKLIENPKLMKQISQNNLREAKEKYDVKVVLTRLENIYQEMINIKGKGK